MVIISVAISVVFGLAFVKIFLSDDHIDLTISNANWSLLLPTPLLYLLGLYLRSRRWSVIITPTADIPRNSLISPVLVGYMINALAPVRLGDFVRGYYVSAKYRCGLLATMGTLAVEKALDTGTVLILFVSGGLLVTNTLDSASALDDIPGGTTTLTIVALGPALVVLAMMITWRILNRGQAGKMEVDETTNEPSGIVQLLRTKINQFSSGTSSLRSGQSLMNTIGYSFVIWAIELAIYALVAMSLGADDSLESFIGFLAIMAVVLAVSNIAVAIPAAFGGIGAFELVAAGTMTSLGIESDLAAAAALSTHFILLATAVVAGTIALLADKSARSAFKARVLGRGSALDSAS
jgi:uncharacterized protein (TIRG00374 family)